MALSKEALAVLGEYDKNPSRAVLKMAALLTAPPGITPQHLEEANVHLTRAIASALALGKIRFLDYSVGWLSGLLVNYGLPPTLTAHYYSAYRQAVQQHLGSQGQPILDWLAKVAQTV